MSVTKVQKPANDHQVGGDYPADAMRHGPHRQRGVALITALLVVALATVATVAMTSRQQIDIRRTQNVLESEQLRFYLYGIEGWAGKILEQDRKDGDTDSYKEDWASRLPPIPVDNGQLAGYVDDAQGRFNLNNLVVDGKTSTADLERLHRLLTALGLIPTLADAVVDWIDNNLDPIPPGGAEDAIYLGLTPPYRAANRMLGDVSELRAIAGFDAETYRKLAPYVVALPTRTPINLNTAPAEVLMALGNDISRSDVDSFIEERNTNAYTSVEDALKHRAFAEHEVVSDGLSVASSHFMVMSDIQIGRLRQRYASLLQRSDKGAITVLTRHQLYL